MKLAKSLGTCVVAFTAMLWSTIVTADTYPVHFTGSSTSANTDFTNAIDEIVSLDDGTALVKLNAANGEQIYWFDGSTYQRGGVNLDSFDGATILTSLQDGTALLQLGVQYYWFDQTTLQRGSVSLDNFDGAIEEILPLGDGTALVKLNAANNGQIYWFDQTTMQRGSVSLDNFDGADLLVSLEDGTGIITISGQFYWFDQTTLQRGSVGLDNFDNVIDEWMALGDGTALLKLNAANNGQIYWFDQTTLQRGSVSLDNFDGSDLYLSLGDGTGIIRISGQHYWFDQTTLQRGSVGLDNLDNVIDEATALGGDGGGAIDGTALLKLNAANNEQIYWFNQSTIVRGGVNLDNFDGGDVTSLQNGTAFVQISGQTYQFDQTTLNRGTVGLADYDNILTTIVPLGDGGALLLADMLADFDCATLEQQVIDLLCGGPLPTSTDEYNADLTAALDAVFASVTGPSAIISDCRGSIADALAP